MYNFLFKSVVCNSHKYKRVVVYKDYCLINKDKKGAIVCVHALGRNASDFDYLANFFSSFYRVISIDLSGHGYSDYIENWQLYKHDLFLEDVLSIFNKENLSEINYIGSSLGGIVGMLMASDKNTPISRLILNDIGPTTKKQKMSKMINLDPDLLRERFSFDSYLDARSKLLKSLAGYNFVTDSAEKMECLLNNSIAKSDDGFYRIRFDPAVLKIIDNTANRMRNEGMWEQWSKIYLPTMLIYGAKSNLINEEIVNEMRNGKKNFFTLKCMQSGHVCSLSNDEQLSFLYNWINGSIKNVNSKEINF